MAERRASPFSPLVSNFEKVIADDLFNVMPSTRENFEAFDLPRGLETNRPVTASRFIVGLFFMKLNYQTFMDMYI